jgi:hypothetical protein
MDDLELDDIARPHVAIILVSGTSIQVSKIFCGNRRSASVSTVLCGRIQTKDRPNSKIKRTASTTSKKQHLGHRKCDSDHQDLLIIIIHRSGKIHLWKSDSSCGFLWYYHVATTPLSKLFWPPEVTTRSSGDLFEWRKEVQTWHRPTSNISSSTININTPNVSQTKR